MNILLTEESVAEVLHSVQETAGLRPKTIPTGKGRNSHENLRGWWAIQVSNLWPLPC